VGLFTLLGIDQVKVYINTPGINFIFYALGFFVVVAAFFGTIFLPPVNEQSILAVQALILLNALAGGVVDWIPMAALTAVPALVCLALLIWPRSFAPEVKAVLYLWYLLSLLAMPFQSGQAAYFRAPLLTWFEAWVFGGLFIFMILHGLFAVRFFLLTSSLILPRNRPAIAPLMARLFSDEQASLPRFALVMALSAGLVLANQGRGRGGPAGDARPVRDDRHPGAGAALLRFLLLQPAHVDDKRAVLRQRGALGAAETLQHHQPGMVEQGFHLLREGIAQRERGHVDQLFSVAAADAPDGRLDLHLGQLIVSLGAAHAHAAALFVLVGEPFFLFQLRAQPVGVWEEDREHEAPARGQVLDHARQVGLLVGAGQHVHEHPAALHDQPEPAAQVNLARVGLYPGDGQSGSLGAGAFQHRREQLHAGHVQPVLRQGNGHAPRSAAQVEHRPAGLAGVIQEHRAFQAEVWVLQIVQFRVQILVHIRVACHSSLHPVPGAAPCHVANPIAMHHEGARRL
jgi:hypothetical protein